MRENLSEYLLLVVHSCDTSGHPCHSNQCQKIADNPGKLSTMKSQPLAHSECLATSSSPFLDSEETRASLGTTTASILRFAKEDKITQAVLYHILKVIVCPFWQAIVVTGNISSTGLCHGQVVGVSRFQSQCYCVPPRSNIHQRRSHAKIYILLHLQMVGERHLHGGVPRFPVVSFTRVRTLFKWFEYRIL